MWLLPTAPTVDEKVLNVFERKLSGAHGRFLDPGAAIIKVKKDQLWRGRFATKALLVAVADQS